MPTNNNSTVVPDDIILTINDFKRSKNGSMINIHGKEYAQVSHRIAVARRNLGAKLQILTEIISIDKETVVVKASGLIGDKVIATGHAEEKRNSSNRINQTSALENCETSAVGRMLAFVGITNDQIASAEEVSQAIEQQDKKIQNALTELNAVSHAGGYQEWLSKNKPFLADLKSKNPLSYEAFMEKFTQSKTNLKVKGVI
jgi:spore germination protein GerM